MNTDVFNIADEKKQAIADAGWAYRGSDGEKILLKLELQHEPDALFDLTYDLELDAKDFEEDLRKKASEFNPEKYAVRYFERKGCKYLEQGLVNGKSIKVALDVLVKSLHELDNSEKEKEEFENKCYEMYKLNWMISHGWTLKEAFGTLANLAAETVETDPTEMSATDSESTLKLFDDTRTAFLDEAGFCGELWVCKDEFLNTEFLDRDYMYSLFKLTSCGSGMKAFYDKHYVEEKKPEEGEKEYTVTMKIEGRFITTVYAKSQEEALEEADSAYCDADFGELRDVDGEAIIMEDEDGNYVWEK